MTEHSKIKIAVIAGGPSSEYEVSLATARNVIGVLDSKKYDIRSIIVNKKGDWKVGHYRKTPKQALAGVQVVFNATHGEWGENGRLQSLLNKHCIPYIGAGPIASALAMDKLASRKLFALNGLLVPETISIRRSELHNFSILQRNLDHKLGFPLVVKPNSRGSSVGVSFVESAKTLIGAVNQAFRYDDTVLAEQYLKGVEVTCGVIDNGRHLIALPPVMIVPRNHFFDYEAKYEPGMCKEVVPAPLGEEINKRIQITAIKTHQVLNMRHYSRTDMIIVGDKLYVLEINSLPGLTKNSLLPKSLTAWGMSFPQFIEHLVGLALSS